MENTRISAETSPNQCVNGQGADCELVKPVYGLVESQTVWDLSHNREVEAGAICNYYILGAFFLVATICFYYLVTQGRFPGEESFDTVRKTRLCLKRRFLTRKYRQRIRLAWNNLTCHYYEILVLARRDEAVAPRQKLFGYLGNVLKQLKRNSFPQQYANDPEIQLQKRYWHNLGELLKRHLWAQKKRARKTLPLVSAPGQGEIAQFFTKIQWWRVNGEFEIN
jgi:hypothetical protein